MLQSIPHFNLTYMVRSAFGIAVRKWPRDAVPLAAAIALIAVVTMVVLDVEIMSAARSARWHRGGQPCRPPGEIRHAARIPAGPVRPDHEQRLLARALVPARMTLAATRAATTRIDVGRGGDKLRRYQFVLAVFNGELPEDSC